MTAHVCTDFGQEVPCRECKLNLDIERLEEQVQRYQEREAHFAKALGVADGGQYRADWPAAIERVVKERDDLRSSITQLAANLRLAMAIIDAWKASR